MHILKVAKNEVTKAKIHNWLLNYLPFNGEWIFSHYPSNQIPGMPGSPYICALEVTALILPFFLLEPIFLP